MNWDPHPNAFRPAFRRESPAPPAWHEPALELSVEYPEPTYGGTYGHAGIYGPYARRKDASLGALSLFRGEMRGGVHAGPRGSRMIGPMMGTPPGVFANRRAFGAEAAPAQVPATVPATTSATASASTDKKKLADLFKKDASGTSKAEQIAKRGVQIFSKPAVQAPAPVVVVPSTSHAELALVGLAALGVGVGVGMGISIALQRMR